MSQDVLQVWKDEMMVQCIAQMKGYGYWTWAIYGDTAVP